MRNRFKIIMLLMVLAVLAGVYLLRQPDPGPLLNVEGTVSAPGRPAPDLTLPRLDGKIVRLADHRGKVVFLNIWATWCPPCREEMPAMEKLYQKMQGEAFEILAVSIDESGAKAVAPFARENNLSFPILLDTRAVSKTLFAITGIPESYIIDKNGTIARRIIGPMDWAGAASVRFFKDLARKPTGEGATR